MWTSLTTGFLFNFPSTWRRRRRRRRGKETKKVEETKEKQERVEMGREERFEGKVFHFKSSGLILTRR